MWFDCQVRVLIDYQRSSYQAAQAVQVGSKQALEQTTGERRLPYHGRNLGGAFKLHIQL